MRNRRKAEKVRYNVGIDGLLKLLLNLGQMFKFPRMLNSIQNTISAAQSTIKVYNS
jgi:hypothetical protein